MLFRPKIKICGITRKEDALAAADLKIPYLGFIFYAGSKRCVTKAQAREIIMAVKSRRPKTKAVGVFVNETQKTIDDIRQFCGLDILQFSGTESPAFCALFNCPVWKTVHVKSEASLAQIGFYIFLPAVHLDKAKDREFGGTGESFDWNLAKKAQKIKRKIILSGGLSSKNLKEAVSLVKPWAVDLNSGVEDSPGCKNIQKMKEVVEIMRKI